MDLDIWNRALSCAASQLESYARNNLLTTPEQRRAALDDALQHAIGIIEMSEHAEAAGGPPDPDETTDGGLAVSGKTISTFITRPLGESASMQVDGREIPGSLRVKVPVLSEARSSADPAGKLTEDELRALVLWHRKRSGADRIIAALRRDICPDCGHIGFRNGPKGGAGQNIFCEGCGAGFNVAFPREIHFAQRITK